MSEAEKMVNELGRCPEKIKYINQKTLELQKRIYCPKCANLFFGKCISENKTFINRDADDSRGKPVFHVVINRTMIQEAIITVHAENEDEAEKAVNYMLNYEGDKFTDNFLWNDQNTDDIYVSFAKQSTRILQGEYTIKDGRLIKNGGGNCL